MAGLDGNVSGGVIKLQRLISTGPNDLTVNLWGWLTHGLDDLFADLLNPEMQFLKSHLYQLSNTNFPLYCK